MAWVPPGMNEKMTGRSTLRKHHDFDETFTFGKNAQLSSLTTPLTEVWASESRTTVSQSQNKDIEKFWTTAKSDKHLLKKTLSVDEAAANRQLFARKPCTMGALHMSDDKERPTSSHYKMTFTKRNGHLQEEEDNNVSAMPPRPVALAHSTPHARSDPASLPSSLPRIANSSIVARFPRRHRTRL